MHPLSIIFLSFSTLLATPVKNENDDVIQVLQLDSCGI